MNNTPTDAEIDEVTLDVLGYAALDKETNDTARMIARAVLAKWGTPQQEAQEPVNGWSVEATIYKRRDEWVLELSGTINDCAFTCRHTQPGYLQPEDVAGLPSLYSEGTAPQPAPAPLSEMPYEKRKAIQEGEQIGASDAWFKARHEMLDTVDRRNVFRAGFDRGWSAAIAAQGGKDA